MQDDDSSEDKQIRSLQEMWQQSITNNSFKIKEREMLREIQYDMDTFDEKFGFGTWKMVILSGCVSLLFLFSATRHILRGNPITPMEIIQFLYLPVFLIQLWTRLEARKYDMSKTEDYYAWSFARVNRQMIFMRLGAPFVLGLTISWIMIDYDPWLQGRDIALLVGGGLIVLASAVYGWWQYRYRLTPLRNRLRDILFDIRNPYPTQNAND
jgi:hypothetical protein